MQRQHFPGVILTFPVPAALLGFSAFSLFGWGEFFLFLLKQLS